MSDRHGGVMPPRGSNRTLPWGWRRHSGGLGCSDCCCPSHPGHQFAQDRGGGRVAPGGAEPAPARCAGPRRGGSLWGTDRSEWRAAAGGGGGRGSGEWARGAAAAGGGRADSTCAAGARAGGAGAGAGHHPEAREMPAGDRDAGACWTPGHARPDGGERVAETTGCGGRGADSGGGRRGGGEAERATPPGAGVLGGTATWVRCSTVVGVSCRSCDGRDQCGQSGGRVRDAATDPGATSPRAHAGTC